MSTTGGSTRTGGIPRGGVSPSRPGASGQAGHSGQQGSGQPGPGQGGRPRPAARPQGRMSPTAAPGDGEPRKARLTVSRVDPFSVMKISFLLSVALGIAMVVVVAALWLMLNSMGVFATINDTFNELQIGDRAGAAVQRHRHPRLRPGAVAVDRVRRRRRHPHDGHRDDHRVHLQHLRGPRGRHAGHADRRLSPRKVQ